MSILLVYFLQGLTWTIYTSKIAAVYHSELGHDVYSASNHHDVHAHHNAGHNPQYVQVGYQMPVDVHQMPVNQNNPPLLYAPVGHQMPVAQHYV